MPLPSYVRHKHPWFGDSVFRTVSQFSVALFLDKWLRGEGGKWVNFIERHIDRKRSQKGGAPIKGGRVFMQTCDWVTGDHPFFSRRGSAVRDNQRPWGFESRMWDYNALANGHRPTRLTNHTQKMILELVRLARKHDWKFELSMDATLKHTKGVGWNVIGHCIRQCNAFLNTVHTGKWDPDVNGDPRLSAITDKIRAKWETVKGPIDHLILVETHNEWDAHSKGAWDRDGLTRAQALAEVNRQLDRMDRVKDGIPEQWPAGGIIVSHGGRDDIEYDGDLATAIAIHPSRPGTRVGDRFDHLRRYGKPIYANELLHYIDPSMWYLVENGTFRQNSSNQNAKKQIQFIDEMNADGLWTCDHGLEGMACGVWVDEDVHWEEMPLDRMEVMRGASLGGGEPPRPNPPPAPPKPAPGPPQPPPPTPAAPWFQVDINNERVLKLQANIGPDGYPHTIRGGSEESVPHPGSTEKGVFRASWSSGDFVGRTVHSVYTFLGLERGDIAELNVFCFDNQVPFAIRDKHKEAMSDFPAWEHHAESRGHVIRGRLTVAVVGRCNGKQMNAEHPRFGTYTIVPHFGAYVVWGNGAGTPAPLPGAAEPPPPASPPSQPAPGRADYMPKWDDMKDAAFRRPPHTGSTWRKALMSIDQQLIWDGIRNPGTAVAAAGYSWPFRGPDSQTDISREKALAIIETSQKLLNRLRHFVEFDPHDPRAVAINGTWLEGRTRKANFEQWYTDFMAFYPWLAAANGIASPGKPI